MVVWISKRCLRRFASVLLSAGLLLASAELHALTADLASAQKALNEGRADDALRALASAGPNDGPEQLLLCRVFYAEEKSEEAIRHCELATTAAPTDSLAALWLGRAYGQRASKANPLSAFGLAKRVRASFERAVQLAPDNPQALSDLGQFDVDAPSIAGGVFENVPRLAQQLLPISAWRAHRLLGAAAEKKGNFTAAESELTTATAGNQPEAWVDLGYFYHRRNDPTRSLAALKAAVAADTAQGPSLVDVASLLTSLHVEPELAISLLRAYLVSPARSDAAPAFKVEVQLGDLLATRGDSAGAQAAYSAARSLASQYTPARKAAQTS